MFNGTLVTEEADHFAERIKTQSPDAEHRLEWAFRAGLGRAPSAIEIDALRPFATDENLPRLARIIFNTNEFVYVD